MEIGEMIKKRREKLGFSQSRLQLWDYWVIRF